MAIQRLNKTWVDGELWDAADDANPIGQKIDEVVDQVNLNTNEIVAARGGEVDLNTRINLAQSSAGVSATNAANSAAAAATSEANAAASASAAATSESNAATSASNAATSASNAATSEANALSYKNTAETAKNNALTYSNDSYGWANTAENTQFTDSQSRSGYSSYHFAQKASASAADAANSASAAATSEANAATSEANALSYLNEFKGRYYGAYSSDPATDPLGNPIDVGDVYYNTTENKLKYWTGSTWGYWSQDADTVDGYHASSFLQASSYTASDVLTKIKTVDGAGSGLDADTLDGYHAADFALNSSFVANDARAKTALNAAGAAPIYACRAWVNFNGTGTVAIRASGNVSSITDNGAGSYTVNFITAMEDANYAVDCSATTGDVGSRLANPAIYSNSSIKINCTTTSNTTLADMNYVNVTIFR